MTLQTKEIHCGDNLTIMKKMSDESVDLIYLDPPFFSGQNYEVIWKDGTEERSFKDTEWYRVECSKCQREVVKAEKFCPICGSDLKDAKITRKNNIYAFVDWLTPRLQEMHRILKPTGSIYVHLDWHAVHYIKIEMDRIFGKGDINKGIECFRNEIIWCYTFGATGKKQFSRKHDNILFYSKTNKWIFNNKEVLRKATSAWANGKMITMQDWWDIPSINNKERLGYPTQKPEALLERIIKASSNPGDIVFDPFCGCGTSLAVAKKLNRNYIGIDVSPTACELIKKRITHLDKIIGFPQSIEEYQKMEPHEFQNLVCRTLEAKNTSPNAKKASGADGGIDGIINPNVFHNFAGSLIQVKRSKNVGINTIKNFESTILHSKTKTGFVVALTFGSGAKKQAKEAEKLGLQIILIKAIELETFDFKNYKATP